MRITKTKLDLPQRLTTLAIGLVLAIPATSAGDGSQLFQAIRNGDLAYVKAHLTKGEIETRDRRGATPLMHAAAFGNVETMKVLLDAGADVNARNEFDATALLWAARNPEKARLLLHRGADVNIQSKQGRTPLMVASLRHGGTALVSLMLAKGADVNAVGGRRRETALALAANVGNAATVKLLLANGADPNKLDGGGMSPLNRASYGKRTEALDTLLRNNVDVNNANTFAGPPPRNGPINRLHITALHNAAAFGPTDMVRDLIKAGAKVNAPDNRGLTPLHFAVASDRPSVDIIRALLHAEASVNAQDTTGETPLDWAEKFGYPDVLAVLKNAGGKRGIYYEPPKLPYVDAPQPVVAIQRSIELLEGSAAEFFNKSGCVGCHHQPLIARAQAAAKASGVPVNEATAKEQTLQMRGQWLALQEEFRQAINPGGGANRLAENLLGLKASGCPPDTITDSAIVDIAESQEPDGSWIAGEVQNRPPIAQSDIAATARAIRVLQEYTVPARQKEFSGRIARARIWLKQQKPQTADDFSMRLSGLTWSRAAGADVRAAARDLIAVQHSDGGWAGNPYLTSDAYATGVALVALAESGVINVNDGPYRRGVKYLLSTQYPDGSWHVRSRAMKFQPYFESGFPFGHDQWISAAATAWAVQAIALGIGQPVTRELQSARLP